MLLLTFVSPVLQFSSVMLSTRAAATGDLLEVLALYREYNQAEPASLSLGLPAKHLETRLAIIASFKGLIETGCVLVCCEGERVVGMAVHYGLSVCPRSQQDIENLTVRLGFPDLAPAFVLSNTAVESSDLATHYRPVISQSTSDRSDRQGSSTRIFKWHTMHHYTIAP